MQGKKAVFSEGRIEIERVINEHGEAVFQVRFPQVERPRHLLPYVGDVVIQVNELRIGDVSYIPVVNAITTVGEETKHRVQFNTNEPYETVQKCEYINL